MSSHQVNKNFSSSQEPVVIETPESQVGQSAKGRYKYEVRDAEGLVYDSGDWKPNLILDCGLDKLADMAWAQTFQWAVVGTNATPTVDKYEDTGLTVKIYQSPNCEAMDIPDDLKCSESPDEPLIVEAIAGCREAPNEPYWYDASEQDMSPQVPVYATKEQRAFGKYTDIGKTIYLRDQNLQFKVLSSCPAYSVAPLHATGNVVSVSGTCGSLLSATMWPRTDPNGTESGLTLNTGAGYFSAGTGNTRKGIRIPTGDPSLPLTDNNGVLTPGAGIRIGSPNGKGAALDIQRDPANRGTTGLINTDIKVMEPGSGYGSDNNCFAVSVNVDRPAYSTGHFGMFADTAASNVIYRAPNFYGNWNVAKTSSGPQLGEELYNQGQRVNRGSGTYTAISNLALTMNQTEYEHVFGADYGANLNELIARCIFVEQFCSYRVGHENLNGSSDWEQYVSTNIAGKSPMVTSANKQWGWGYSMNPGPGGANNGTTYRETHTNGYFTAMGMTADDVWGNNIWEQQVLGQSSFHSNVAAVRNKIDDNFSTHAKLEAAIKAGEIGNIRMVDVINTLAGVDVSTLPQNNAFFDVAAPAGSWVDLDFDAGDVKNWWCTSTKHKVNGRYPTTKIIDNSQLAHGGGGIGHTNQLNSNDAWAVASNGRNNISGNQGTVGSFGERSLGAPLWMNLTDPDTAGHIGQGGDQMGNGRLNSDIGVYGSDTSLSEVVKWKTDQYGVINGVSINPVKWLHAYLCSFKVARSTLRASDTVWSIARIHEDELENITFGTFGPLMTKWWEKGGDWNVFGQVKAAQVTMSREGCGLGEPSLVDPGRGYVPEEVVSSAVTGPTLKQATGVAICDDLDGKIIGFQITDPGSGYSCTDPTTITFPAPPPAQVLKYNLIVKPVNTYENENNNFYWKNTFLPIQGPCDVYNTEQTYLGQGKHEFGDGTPVYDGEGGHEGRGTRYGPCHFVTHQYTKNWTEYDIDEDLAATPGGKRTPISKTQEITHNQYKTHGWYVTGNDYETNSIYCGTDYLSTGNQVSMTRSFDFYMELQPVTYAEIGFKDSPASRELFSRIVFDDPVRLAPGQYLRIAYQLLVTMEPGPTARFREVPSEGTWTNGTRSWTNVNNNKTETINVLSGYECIQGNGIAIVDEHGIATPYDITGVANEPFAPGSYFLGPNQGYPNRWKNGDTRLSFPTREYNNDINNPWILGGDQMNPPDWGIKFFDSPTQNYRPRDFATFLEWPWYQTDIIDYENEEPGAVKYITDVNMPCGPEVTLERDAFTHWFTPTFPNATTYGTITWTNFVANKHNSGNPMGRWDYHCVKPYVREIYPNMMKEPNVHGIRIKDSWYEKYRYGDLLAKSGKTEFRSAPGVFPGPIIEYDGDFGGLWDPTSVSTVRYNNLSPTTGGINSKATYSVRNPYTNEPMKMLEPHNTGFGGDLWTMTQVGGCPGVSNTYTTGPNYWCWKNHEPIDRDEVFGPMGLVKRQTDYTMTSVKTAQYYPVHKSYGGGFTTLDAFKGWSHTPLINYKKGRTVDDGTAISPDTVGNWAKADAIPVAGPAAFISTSDASFAVVGEYYNRSHTIFGAVCGLNGDPEHDFDGSKSAAARQPGGDAHGREIDLSETVDAGDRCFEAPVYLNDYKRGDHYREKYAEWETSFGNLTGIKSIGLGPVSTTMKPLEMTDAARFNTYVFKFGNAGLTGPSQAYDNLTTFKLKTTFKHTWYRDLT